MSHEPNLPANLPAFSRLHPACRRRCTGCAGRKLRPIQVEAIHEVFDGEGDLIISARTAAGKTEAAFLPILSRIVDDREGAFVRSTPVRSRR